MEELIRKLTEAIADFNRYIKNEYSAINKNYSGIENSLGDYSIYTIVAPKLVNFKINKTFPRANFITTKIDNSTDVVYLTTNAMTKEKLEFRDGSRYEGIFSDLYLTYDFSSYGVLPNVQIFIGYNSKYIPITTVKIADIDSSNPLPIKIQDEKVVVTRFYNVGESVNNSVQNMVAPSNISGHIVKGYMSMVITNLDDTNTLYFGGNIDGSNYQTQGVPILAGEKLTVDFKQLAQSGFTYKLFSPDNIKFSVCYMYVE